MPGAMIAVFFFVVVIFIGLAILASYQKRKRQEALFSLSQRLGLRFSATDSSGAQRRYGHFSPFQHGDHRYAFNILEGAYGGREVCCFEFHYETHSTDSKGRRHTHHHYLSAAAVPLPASFPTLLIRPESIFDKLAGFVGFDDIDFESAEFSRRFFVKSQDKKFAYDIVHARAMEFLMHDVRSGLAFELAGPAILIYSGSTWDVEQIAPALDSLIGFVALIPDYVWENAKTRKELNS